MSGGPRDRAVQFLDVLRRVAKSTAVWWREHHPFWWIAQEVVRLRKAHDAMSVIIMTVPAAVGDRAGAAQALVRREPLAA